jgi:hypothetical protein
MREIEISLYLSYLLKGSVLGLFPPTYLQQIEMCERKLIY